MAAPIQPIGAVPAPSSIRPAGEAAPAGGFQQIFSSAVGKVESMGEDAARSVERFLSGDGEDLHTAVLAAQRAELTFEMFQQIRNKVVSAYQEVMRMQM